MDLKITLACVFFQVGLTFYGVMMLGHSRLKAFRETDLAVKDIALASAAYPDEARKHSNNLSNQFEFPVLFYVAAVLAATFEATSVVMAAASIGYVASRLYHRMIHVGTNHVVKRFNVFLAGIAFLFIMWVALGLALLGVL